MDNTHSSDAAEEWLETDGLGGFACMPVHGPRTRRYHGLLIPATKPPADRSVLLNGVEAHIVTPVGRFKITQQCYVGEHGDVLDPPSLQCAVATFESEPWPRWICRLPDGTRIAHEAFLAHGSPTLIMTWRLIERGGAAATSLSFTLSLRPLLSARNYHSLHRENPAFRFEPWANNGIVHWRPYESLPGVVVRANGWYLHEPLWYRNVLYAEERARGFDCVEDLASPGVFQFDLAAGEAVLMASSDSAASMVNIAEGRITDILQAFRSQEQARRERFATPLHRAADQYIVKRGEGKTIIAGYPWFADWGRDTFIAMRGLCVATGRLADALLILLSWALHVDRGMLPNRFPDSSSGGSSEPEYNSVDAPLWYVIAIYEFLEAVPCANCALTERDRRALLRAVQEILNAYSEGTRFGIRRDPQDGLLAAGERGQQLTWMDARVGDREITPRIGKPVEINALWINALWIGSRLLSRAWEEQYLLARASFRQKFWNAERACLYDVIDVDHRAGEVDASIRPNQIFAVGGLPTPVLEGEQARSVVDVVERELWTPMGVRSLSPRDEEYIPRYEGGPAQRDGAYHQGAVWPWLAGAFIEAHVRVHGSSDRARREARMRLLEPLLKHLPEAGVGHIAEIADGNAPHAPRGCPFQAWSLGEILRLKLKVLRIANANGVSPAHSKTDGAPARTGSPSAGRVSCETIRECDERRPVRSRPTAEETVDERCPGARRHR